MTAREIQVTFDCADPAALATHLVGRGATRDRLVWAAPI